MRDPYDSLIWSKLKTGSVTSSEVSAGVTLSSEKTVLQISHCKAVSVKYPR